MNKETTLQISAVTNKHERCSRCHRNSEEAGELTAVTFGLVNFRLCNEYANTIISVLELRCKEE